MCQVKLFSKKISCKAQKEHENAHKSDLIFHLTRTRGSHEWKCRKGRWREIFKSQKEYKINKLKDMTIFLLQHFFFSLLSYSSCFISIRTALSFFFVLARNQNKFSFASFRILFLFFRQFFFVFIFTLFRVCLLVYSFCWWKKWSYRDRACM